MSQWLIFLFIIFILMLPVSQTTVQKGGEPTATIQQKDDLRDYVEDELLATTDTKAQAEAIAQQYDIELIFWESGLAVFHTDRNVLDVIDEGKANGWPLLSLNMKRPIITTGPR